MNLFEMAALTARTLHAPVSAGWVQQGRPRRRAPLKGGRLGLLQVARTLTL